MRKVIITGFTLIRIKVFTSLSPRVVLGDLTEALPEITASCDGGLSGGSGLGLNTKLGWSLTSCLNTRERRRRSVLLLSELQRGLGSLPALLPLLAGVGGNVAGRDSAGLLSLLFTWAWDRFLCQNCVPAPRTFPKSVNRVWLRCCIFSSLDSF